MNKPTALPRPDAEHAQALAVVPAVVSGRGARGLRAPVMRYCCLSIRKGMAMNANRILVAVALYASAGLTCSALAAENARPPFAKSCGRSTMIVRCSNDSPACERNELVLRTGTSQPVVLPPPQGLEKYDPVGLACSRSADATPFFIVEYGDASHSCASCEWHHIYAADGRLLTKSDPAFVSDPSLPGAQSVHPNTADFTRVSKDLGLSKAAVVYGH
jgi:hypothetical protein